jgi:hypothetical protein
MFENYERNGFRFQRLLDERRIITRGQGCDVEMVELP